MISSCMKKTFHLLIAIALLSTVALTAAPARAASTINVTVNWDAFPGDALCSLREALIAANTDTAVDACPAGNGTDTILVPGGVYELLLPGMNEDASLTGDLDITEDVIIIGDGSDGPSATTITGNYSDRVFHILGDATVEISSVEIIHGDSDTGGGAGILNESGTLTLTDVNINNNMASLGGGGGIVNSYYGVITITDSRIDQNTAGYGHGGGILNEGSMTITDSDVNENIAEYQGGGILNAGTLTLTNTTLNGNSSSSGGGVYNTSLTYLDIGGTLTIVNSTLSGNSANYGGGIYNWETVTLINSTLSGNQANDNGGGIHNPGTAKLYNVTVAYNTADLDADEQGDGGGVLITTEGTLTLSNSIIARNTDNSPVTKQGDCSGAIISLGYNLLQKTNGCMMLGVKPSITGVPPHVEPLQDNGGATWTHALLPNSPAIDAGNPAGCKDHNGMLLTTDQRDFTRALDGDGDKIKVCDIGAFERQFP
jgi:hypothetical protein